MSGSIVQLNAAAHQEAQELLPWFVLGTLDENETALVEDHLRLCTQCQADIELQRKLQAVKLPVRVELDVESALAKLRPRLTPQPAAKKAPAFGAALESLQRAAKQWWMPWVMAAQSVALAGLCIVVLQGQPAGNDYHLLGAKVAGGGNVVVMFKPQTSEQELRRILQTADARVIDGPTVAGAYVLHVDDAERVRALAALRGEQAITMAESLDNGGAR